MTHREPPDRPSRMDEQWQAEQEQERAWAQSLADDPAWLLWNAELELQHAAAQADDDTNQSQ